MRLRQLLLLLASRFFPSFSVFSFPSPPISLKTNTFLCLCVCVRVRACVGVLGRTRCRFFLLLFPFLRLFSFGFPPPTSLSEPGACRDGQSWATCALGTAAPLDDRALGVLSCASPVALSIPVPATASVPLGGRSIRLPKSWSRWECGACPPPVGRNPSAGWPRLLPRPPSCLALFDKRVSVSSGPVQCVCSSPAKLCACACKCCSLPSPSLCGVSVCTLVVSPCSAHAHVGSSP
jgi:hypothetical protein